MLSHVKNSEKTPTLHTKLFADHPEKERRVENLPRKKNAVEVTCNNAIIYVSGM